jgi:hypothetical protein
MSLWKFDFVVDGKNLERVMESLTGIALDFQPPRRIGNAVVQQGKIKAASSATTIKELVINDIKAMPPNTVFGSNNVKEIIKRHNGAESGYAHYIIAILEAGAATRRGRGHFVTK